MKLTLYTFCQPHVLLWQQTCLCSQPCRNFWEQWSQINTDMEIYPWVPSQPRKNVKKIWWVLPLSQTLWRFIKPVLRSMLIVYLLPEPMENFYHIAILIVHLYIIAHTVGWVEGHHPMSLQLVGGDDGFQQVLGIIVHSLCLITYQKMIYIIILCK